MYLFRRLVLPPLFAATLLIGAVALIASGTGRGAQAADSANPPRTIVVSGDGDVSAKPDQARLSAGVVTQGQSAEDAEQSQKNSFHPFTTSSINFGNFGGGSSAISYAA